MLNNIIIIIIIMRFRVCDDILVLAEVNENDDMWCNVNRLSGRITKLMCSVQFVELCEMRDGNGKYAADSMRCSNDFVLQTNKKRIARPTDPRI